MPQILLCSGVYWASLLEQRKEWLGKTQGKSVCIIPAGLSPEKIRETLKESLPACTVNSTEEIVQHFLEQSQGGRDTRSSLISRQTVDYLLDTIIRNPQEDSLPDIAPATASRYLNIETQRPGYIRALGEFIYNFRKTHYEDLLPTLTSFNQGKLSTKERDLIDIHDELERLLSERELFDYRRAVLCLAGRGTSKLLIQEPLEIQDTLILIGFSRLTSLDHKLLLWLISRFKQSLILTCRNPNASRAVFKAQVPLEGFIKEVKETWAGYIEEKTITCKMDSPLLPLAERIFSENKACTPPELSSRVKITQANSRYHEVTLIARTVRKLNQEQVPFSSIRVIFPNFELYTALLMEIFPRYKIPYTLQEGTPLQFFPLAQTIQNMISQAVTPNPFLLREKIFSSPYISFSCEVSAKALHYFTDSHAADILENKKLINAFLPAPRTVKLDYAGILELQRHAVQAVKSTERLKPVQLAILYIKERCSGKASVRDQKIIEILETYYVLSRAEITLSVFRAEMTPDAFCRAIGRLIERFHIEENTFQTGPGEEPILQTLLDQDKRVLETICLALEKLKEHFLLLSSSREKKFSLLELVRAYTGLISDPKLKVPTPATAGVIVYSTSEAQVLFRPFTIIGGLVDGELPAKEPFNFLEPRREGRALLGNLNLVDQERLALYQVIASTMDSLYIFYPASDKGKKLMSSPFIAEIEKYLTCTGKEISLKQDTHYTQREKLIFAGRDIDRSYSRVLPVLKELEGSSPDYFHHIISVFRCDGLRAGLKGFTRFDGKFQSQPALSSIQNQVGEGFVFNVEKLERYAGCPLRFLFDNLMNLKADYMLDYHPDETDRGLLIRRILTEYSKEAASRRESDREKETIQQIAEKALKEMLIEKDDLFSRRFKHMILMGLDAQDGSTQKRPGLLCSFLEYERNGPDRLKPYLAGLCFGRPGFNDFKVMDIPIDITIERVDCTSNNKYLILYNFSISDPGYVNGICKGLRFRLPLQVLALKEFVEINSINKRVGGGGTYLVKNPRTIKRGGYFALKELQASRIKNVSESRPLFSGQRGYGFLPELDFEEELENTSNRVRQIAGLIRKGCFNPPLCSVKDQTCLNCRFERICRKDQLRLDKLYTLIDCEEVYKPRRRMN